MGGVGRGRVGSGEGWDEESSGGLWRGVVTTWMS